MDSRNETPSERIHPGVEDYIKFQELLKQRCRKLKSIHGIHKLERKINAEMKFLILLQAQDDVTQKSHLKSSNLSHFSSLVHAAELLPGVVLVLQPFLMPSRSDSLVVDIVAAGGHAWVKVIARKAQALHLVWAGQGQFGERDLVSQAEEYLECATRHPFEFSVPQVHFAFYNQVTQPMADCLKKMGVSVWGEVVPVEKNVQAKLETFLDDDRCTGSDTDESDDEKLNILDTACSDREGVKCGSSSDEFSSTDCSDGLSFSTETSAGIPYNTDSLAIIHHSTSSLAQTTSSLAQTTSCLVADPDSTSSLVAIPDSSSSLTQITSTLVDIPHTTSSLAAVCHSTSSSGEIPHSTCTTTDLPHNTYHIDPSEADIVQICKTFDVLHSDHNINGCVKISAETKCVTETSSFPYTPVDFNISSLTFDSLFRHLVASPPDFGQALVVDQSVSSITRVNLDITALIALVSSVTNGNCHYVFRDKVLNLQANEERDLAVLPVLERYLIGKEVFVCETAVSSFQSILDILGGQAEKRRAAELLSRVQLVKDDPSKRALALDCQGRVKERSKVIFGTGDSLQAVTMTSNIGFVRAAKSQGVVFSVFLHPARALTEEKERHAVPLSEAGQSAEPL